MNNLYLGIYRLLITPSSIFLFLFLSLFMKKMRQGLKLRLSRQFRPPYPKSSKNSQPIWFHCSSGEFEYARPVIREIKKRDPQQKILVTFYSPSFLKSILKEELVDHCYPLPTDTPSAVTSFINHFQPKKILFARTDLWPELLTQANKRKIPTCLFSRTEKKQGQNFWQSLFSPWLYKKLDHIFFASQKDLSNHLEIYKTPDHKMSVSGDTRYDQVIFKEKQSQNPITLMPTNFCLVLGSVWPEDLKQILKTCINLYNNKKIQLVIAPHEYNDDFKKIIKTYHDHLQFSSKDRNWNGDKILVIDEFGLLFDCYRSANLSFIGGSFKKNVHSVMEALACGSPVVVGPKNQNNREAQDFKVKFLGRNTPMVSEVKSEKSFQKVLTEVMALEVTRTEIKNNIIDELLFKAGASHDIADWALKPNSYS